MENNAAALPRFPAAAERLLVFLLAGVTVLLALTLACSQFQPGYNSDLLWPQVFAHDLGDPLHPISGWKFGSAPFWFPDFAIFLPLYWLGGDSGLNYPLYAVVIYLVLGLVMTWALAEAGVARIKAALLAFLAVDGLLLCQFLPGHANGLWLIGTPAEHGGSLLTGFMILALGLRAVRAGSWRQWCSLSLVTVMTLGLLSDALLLFHWIIPLGLALAWLKRQDLRLKPVLQGFVVRCVLALSLALVVRLTMALTGWFLFYRLVREWPLPSLIGQTISQFLADFIHHGLFTQQWLFWLIMTGAVVLLVRQFRSPHQNITSTLPRLALITCGLGLGLAWIVPMGAIYWHDVMSFRYLLNWIVVPAWMLALALGLNSKNIRWVTPLAAGIGLLGLTLGFGKLELDKLTFPQLSGAQALRDYCAKNNLREGLADYWGDHFLRVAWNFDGPRLSQIREKDFTYFWCSNVFDNFPAATNEPGLHRPAPQFIVLNGLDHAQIAAWLGGEPWQSEMVGPYEVARLTPTQMNRAAELINRQSQEVLAGRRADWLKTQLPPAS